MGTKRGRGRGGFIDSVLDLVDTFYADVVQHMKAWSAAPPRMREAEPVPTDPPALSSTSLSSQDGAEPVEDNPSNGNGQHSTDASPSPAIEPFQTSFQHVSQN